MKVRIHYYMLFLLSYCPWTVVFSDCNAANALPNAVWLMLPNQILNALIPCLFQGPDALLFLRFERPAFKSTVFQPARR